ncbi:uncharacterized protein [Nicotiana tomentosiformis]|uniref:uncharacterized protein n=1 Tax=Nicotiana tomentosiformis TaxID=4098 RepID=UPI00388C8EA7
MAATSKPSKQQERDNNKQPPKKPTRKATGALNPQNKRKRTEKEKKLPTRQLIDESEQEEEEPLSKASKQSDSNDKGKQKTTVESEYESDSDDELPHVDMSDEDKGEPIDQAAWEKNFVSEKAFRAYNKILGSKKYIPEKPINIGALKKNYQIF